MYKVEKVDLKLILTINDIEYESNTTTAVTVCEYCVASNNDALCETMKHYCKSTSSTYFTARGEK